MDDPALAAIGARIELPGPISYPSETGRGAARPAGADRLCDLAAWWASVSVAGASAAGAGEGEPEAGGRPPRRVEQLWLGEPPSAPPAIAQVLIRRFAPPPAVQDALAWGTSVADDAADDGTDLLLVSVGGDPGADLGWRILAGHLLGLDAVEAMGWPADSGCTDADWVRQVAGIRDGLRALRPQLGPPAAPAELLAALGSRPLAAGTGLLLQAAARRTPALLDGPGAAACALLADRIARASRGWFYAGDSTGLALHERILSELLLPPLTRLGLTGESGTGARIALALLETALHRERRPIGQDG